MRMKSNEYSNKLWKYIEVDDAFPVLINDAVKQHYNMLALREYAMELGWRWTPHRASFGVFLDTTGFVPSKAPTLKEISHV